MKKLKIVAGLAFLLNTLLFGSYYSVAKEALGRIDPIVFTFFTMMTLVPPAIFIIAVSWKHMTKEAVKSGFVLGSCLCLGLFTLAVALKYNSATGTAFFPSLNALLAVFFTWVFLRQPMNKATWFAGLVSVIGAIMLMANASIGGARGAMIAFIGGLFCTFYVFLSEHEQKDPQIYWPLFGIELLTMALWANLIALLFGNWQVVNFTFPKDGFVILYIGLGTIFLPTLISLLLQKYISPITVSFIYILEPIMGTLVAWLYLHEVLPLDGYLGGGLIVVGAVIHTWGTVERPTNTFVLRRRLLVAGQRMHASLISTLVYPVLCCSVGLFLIYKLGGFPPTVWHDLYLMSPQIPALIRQGHGSDAFLLIAQSLSWLIAWISLAVIGCLAFYHAARRLFYKPQTINVNVRTLRQLGYTPALNPGARRKYNNPAVERRRQNRLQRLRNKPISPTDGAELVTEPFSFPIEEPHYTLADHEPYTCSFPTPKTALHKSARTRLIAFASGTPVAAGFMHAEKTSISTDQHKYDTFGNHWAYWDDLGTAEMREQ